MPKTKRKKVTWKQHKRRWSNCDNCLLCHRRTKVVLARGSLPCDVLFIGEAPGDSEDVLGKPFIGPAGRLLDEMIEHSLPDDSSVSTAFTNLVGCIPKDETNRKSGEPPEESIKACQERLAELVSIAKPRMIVCVGRLSAKWMALNFSEEELPVCYEISHPAYIIRLDVSQKGLAIQRTIVALNDAFEEEL